MHAEREILPSPVLLMASAGAALALSMLFARRRLAQRLRWAVDGPARRRSPTARSCSAEVEPKKLVAPPGARGRVPWFVADSRRRRRRRERAHLAGAGRRRRSRRARACRAWPTAARRRRDAHGPRRRQPRARRRRLGRSALPRGADDGAHRPLTVGARGHLRRHAAASSCAACSSSAILCATLFGVCLGSAHSPSSTDHPSIFSAWTSSASSPSTSGTIRAPGPSGCASFAASCRRSDAHLVGLQEVLHLDAGSTPDQAQAIADGLGYYSAFASAWHIGGGLQFGNALSSRFPIVAAQAFLLPCEPGDETRALLYCSVDAPCGKIPVFVTHLIVEAASVGHSPAAGGVHRRAHQGARARRRASFPPVLMGDFNAEPESDEIRYLRGYNARLGRSVYFADCFAVAGDGSPGYTYARDEHASRCAPASPIAASTTSSCAAPIARCVGSRSPPVAASPTPSAASFPRIIMAFSPRSRPRRASSSRSSPPGGPSPHCASSCTFLDEKSRAGSALTPATVDPTAALLGCVPPGCQLSTQGSRRDNRARSFAFPNS